MATCASNAQCGDPKPYCAPKDATKPKSEWTYECVNDKNIEDLAECTFSGRAEPLMCQRINMKGGEKWCAVERKGLKLEWTTPSLKPFKRLDGHTRFGVHHEGENASAFLRLQTSFPWSYVTTLERSRIF